MHEMRPFDLGSLPPLSTKVDTDVIHVTMPSLSIFCILKTWQWEGLGARPCWLLPKSALNTELHSCMLQLHLFFVDSQEFLKVILVHVDPHFFCKEVYHTFCVIYCAVTDWAQEPSISSWICIWKYYITSQRKSECTLGRSRLHFAGL